MTSAVAPSAARLAAARALLNDRDVAAPDGARAALGVAAVDAALGGGLALGACHELFAGTQADRGAALGFLCGLLARCAGAGPILWIEQHMLARLAGGVHAPGLAELGLDPARLVVARARGVDDVLRALAEGARTAALGAVVAELWGGAAALDLTASRKLALAARASGVPVFVARVDAEPQPSAAATRWRVTAARSAVLAGGAPGWPTVRAELLRQRGGRAGAWTLAWERDAGRFALADADLGREPGTRARDAGAGGRVAGAVAGRPGGSWRRAA